MTFRPAHEYSKFDWNNWGKGDINIEGSISDLNISGDSNLNDSSSSEVDTLHNLDNDPKTFLEFANSTDENPFHDSNCNVRNTNGQIIVPEIPLRCALKWKIVKELARGVDAVVFTLQTNMEQKMVARISKLSNSSYDYKLSDEERFKRDIETRFRLTCAKVKGVVGLLDAFICEHKNDNKEQTKFGITVSEMYDNNLHGYITEILKNNDERRKFIHRNESNIIESLKNIHGEGFAHCDINPENILVKVGTNTEELAFTDFAVVQSAKFFGSERRIMDAMSYNDTAELKLLFLCYAEIMDKVDGEIQKYTTKKVERTINELGWKEDHFRSDKQS
jgi:hypothetical protein